MQQTVYCMSGICIKQYAVCLVSVSSVNKSEIFAPAVTVSVFLEIQIIFEKVQEGTKPAHICSNSGVQEVLILDSYLR